MRLDRNINPDGRGKYALLRLRKIPEPNSPQYEAVCQALGVLTAAGILEHGFVGTEGEFFPIFIRDRYARPALTAYARAARVDHQEEYADDIFEIAERSGTASPFCKTPD